MIETADGRPQGGWLLQLLMVITRCGRILPPQLAWWLGSVLGHAYALCARRDPKRTQAHLRRAWPDRDPAWIERCTRNCFRHFGGMALWNLATLHIDPRVLRRRLGVVGGDHLRATVRACRRGEGTLICCGHIGNWELLGRCCGTLFPAHVLAKRQRHPDIEAFIRWLRTAHGNRQIYQDQGLAACARPLRQGHVVATLPDQDIRRLQGCFVPWFGHPAYTPVGPAALAQMTRCPIQMIHCVRIAERWVVVAGPRLHMHHGPDRHANILAMTAAATADLERIVRRHPQQWAWWHKRWRTTIEQRPEALRMG